MSKRAALSTLFGVGLLLAGILVFDVIQDWIVEGNSLWSTAVENGPALVLALAIPAVGWGLARREPPGRFLAEATTWTLAGCIGTSVLGGLIIGLQFLQGSLKPLILLTQLSVLGAVAGLYVGYRVAREKRARSELAGEEARIRGLANSIPGIVFQLRTWPEGAYAFSFVGEHAEDLLGLSPERDDLFSALVERVPDTHRDDLFSSLDRAKSKMESFQFEVPYQTPTDEEIWLLGTATPQMEGDEIVFNGVLLDVTDRKEAEEGLRRRQTHLATAQRIANLGSWELNYQEDVLYWSDETKRIFGWGVDEQVTYERFMEAVHPDDRDDLRRQQDRLFAEGTPIETEYRIVRPDGEERIVQERSEAEFDEHGTPTRGWGTVLDVTSLKDREKRLRQTTARLEALYDASPDMIDIHDVEGNLIDPNKQLLEKTGYAEAELTGMKVWELDDALDPQEAREIWASIETGDRHKVEGRYVRKDGSTFPVEVHLRRLDLEGADRFMAISRDISDRKEKEQQLQQKKRRYQAVFEDPNLLVGLLDTDGIVLNVNQTTLEYVDASEEDVRGQLFWDTPWFAGDASLRDQIKSWTARAAEGEYLDFEVDLGPSLGEQFVLNGVFRPVFSDEDEVTSILITARDVTKRRSMETRLRRGREKIESLYQATSRLLTANAKDEVATRVERTLCDVFDYALIGINFEEGGHLTPAEFQVPADEEVPSPQPRSVDGDSMVARAYRAGKRVIVHDLEALDNEIDYGALQSGAAFPVGEHGVIVLGRTTNDAYASFDVRLIEILAAHASIVLDRIEQVQALREERDLLDRILETSPAAIVLFNREGQFVQASGRAEEILGLERDAVTDRTYNDPEWGITTPEGEPLPDDQLPFAQVMRTGESIHDFEHAIVWPDGTRRLLSVSGAPLTAATGGIEGAVFHLEDITERREAERALRRSEQRFRKVFENAAIGIAIVDDDQQLVRVNPAFREMTGYRDEEVEGRAMEAFAHSDDVAEHRRGFNEVLEGARDRYQLETRYIRADGSSFWGRLVISPHQGTGQGEVIAMIEDIDEQKRHEDRLREAKEEAEEATHLKSAMLANMSHEIRTPLTSITGFAEILTEELSGEPADMVNRIHRSGQRLMNTLDTVLQLSKLEAGAFQMDREVVVLDEAVEETLGILRPTAEEKGVIVRVECEETPVQGRWNEGAVNRIIENLVGNAIKFTPDGGTVTVRVESTDRAGVLTVEDTGIGIDPDSLSDIFEPFKQESEGLTREYEGTGLGLSIVNRLVERLDGTIDVESEKGEGTSFAVRLPLQRDESD